MSNTHQDQAATLRTAAQKDAGSAKPIRVIAVTSGKGGVGKTNLVTNMAIAMGRMGKNVLVFDADLSLANVDIILGLAPDYHIGHVFSGERRLEEVLVEGPAGIKILPASSGVHELTLLADWQKMALLEQMDSLGDRLDVLFIDTAAGIGSNVIYFNLAAQERVVVVTPEPTSITDAYALIKVLFTRHQEREFKILVNETRSEKEGKEVYRKLVSVADRFLTGVSLDYLGHVPLDASLPKAVRRQEAVVEIFPESPASRQIVQLARDLLNSPQRARLEAGMRFFWKRLFEAQARGL